MLYPGRHDPLPGRFWKDTSMASYQVLAADWNSVICGQVLGGLELEQANTFWPLAGSTILHGSLPLEQLM